MVKTAEGSDICAVKWTSHVKIFGGYIVDLDEPEMFGDLQGVWIKSEPQKGPRGVV